jgi:hypothetical protein
MKETEDRREGFTDAFTLKRDLASEELEIGAPSQSADEIKRVARAFGAGLVAKSIRNQAGPPPASS